MKSKGKHLTHGRKHLPPKDTSVLAPMDMLAKTPAISPSLRQEQAIQALEGDHGDAGSY